MTQPEALGYAVSLEARGFVAEAKELRRLHEENEELRKALAQPEQDELVKQAYLDGLNNGIEAEREACARLIEDWDSDMMDPRDGADAIRARGEK